MLEEDNRKRTACRAAIDPHVAAMRGRHATELRDVGRHRKRRCKPLVHE